MQVVKDSETRPPESTNGKRPGLGARLVPRTEPACECRVHLGEIARRGNACRRYASKCETMTSSSPRQARNLGPSTTSPTTNLNSSRKARHTATTISWPKRGWPLTTRRANWGGSCKPLVRRLQIKALKRTATKLLPVGHASVSQGHQRSRYLPF